MKWINCKIMIFLCYFVAFNCFSLAVFLPQVLNWSKVNLPYTAESAELKAGATISMAQELPGKRPIRRPKRPESIPASYYGLEK